MNLFVLHQLAAQAAELHCDVHVVKMILETAQILYTALSEVQIEINGYKPTHKHHPVVLWCSSNAAHFDWALKLAFSLCDVYERRYAKTHKTRAHLLRIQRVFELSRSRFPSVRSPSEWKAHLEALGKPPNVVDSCVSRVATNPPSGCSFGVVCIEDGLRDELVVEVDGRVDCVESYRRFYSHKAKKAFVMKWDKQFCVPPALASVFSSVYPDEQPLMVNKPRKSPGKKSDATPMERRGIKKKSRKIRTVDAADDPDECCICLITPPKKRWCTFPCTHKTCAQCFAKIDFCPICRTGKDGELGIVRQERQEREEREEREERQAREAQQGRPSVGRVVFFQGGSGGSPIDAEGMTFTITNPGTLRSVLPQILEMGEFFNRERSLTMGQRQHVVSQIMRGVNVRDIHGARIPPSSDRRE